MKVKKVPLQDLELWPDEVVCFTAYTDTRNPVQQRRTYVDGSALKAENEKLREERDHWHVEQVHAYGNWEDAHKRVIELEAENAKLRDDLQTQREVAAHNTNRNAREYKRVCDENAKLRETCFDAHRWMDRALYDGSARRYEYESITERMRELGIEVDG